eukprot:m51a1_g2306 hypothetical protein (422) ;mRNA; f:452862-454296
MNALTALRLCFFCLHGSTGAIEPFLAVILTKGAGFSATAVGFLLGLKPIAVALGAPLWASFGDSGPRSHARATLVASAAAVCGALLAAYATYARSLLALAPAVVALSSARAGLVPLLDAASVAAAGAGAYGPLRLWGGIGYASGALTVGALLDGMGPIAAFGAFVALVSVVGYVGSSAVQAPREAGAGEAPKRVSSPGPSRGCRELARVWAVLALPRAWAFAVAVLAAGVANLTVTMFVPLLLSQRHQQPAWVLGVAIGISVAGELPLFALAPQALRVLGKGDTGNMISIALVATVARLCLCALAPNALLVLASQALHAVTFGCMWPNLIARASEIAPPELSSTAIGMVTGLYAGVGTALASIVGGRMWDTTGRESVFYAASAFAALAFAVFELWGHNRCWTSAERQRPAVGKDEAEYGVV